MKFYLTIFGIILAFGLVSGVSIQRFIIKEVTVEVYPNPFVKKVSVTINGEYNDTVTIEMPILKELPTSIMVSNILFSIYTLSVPYNTAREAWKSTMNGCEKVHYFYQLKNDIVYNGESIPPMKGELCNLFDDKMFAPEVLDAGVPRDEFPKQCPVLPNMKYTILNYNVSPEKIPPGLPDGPVISDIYVSLDGDDSDPLLIIHAKSLLHTDVPDPSSLMG